MKILHIGMEIMPAISRELSKLGGYRFLDWTYFMELGPAGQELLRLEIIKVTDQMNPDVTLLHVQRPGVITPAMAQSLKGFKINYTYDVARPIPSWYYDLAGIVDLTIFCDETGVEEFHSNGFESEFLHVGYDDKIFKPNGTRGSYGDIVFLGNNYDVSQKFELTQMRIDMVKFLKDKFGDSFKVYGNKWAFDDGNLMYNEYKEAECYRSCNIAINISHFDLERYTSDRMFRIMGSGAFCLTKWYPGIEKDFTDGIHLRVWKDFDELKLLIDYYTKNEEARNNIARTGQLFVNENATWEARIKTIMDMAKARMSKEYKSRIVKVAQQVHLKNPEAFMEYVPAVVPVIDNTYQEYKEPDSTHKSTRILYTSFYKDKNAVRQNEIELCMYNNIQNPFIDKIFVVIQEPFENFPILKNEKVITIQSDVRPTYQFFFDLINANCKDDDISIIANTDIYFDESIKGFDVIDFTNACCALCRWDQMSNGSIKFYNHVDSQDVWAFEGKVKEIEFANFNLGKRGCDNRISHELSKAGYTIYTPAKTIRTIHCHLSNIRNYPASGVDDVPPPYLTLAVTDLADVPKRKKKKIFSVLHIGFDVPTLAKALKKLGNYHFINWPEMRGNPAHLKHQIISSSIRMNSDLVFIHVQTPDIIEPDTVRQLKGFVVNWTGDVRAPIPKWYYDIGKHINLTCFSNDTDVKIFQKFGSNAAYLQVGFDNEIFVPTGVKDESSEIVFMGNNYGMFPLSKLREDTVKFIYSKFGQRFKMYGGGWSYPNAGNLMGNERGEAAVYRGCKMAINLSHFDYERYSSDRMLRIMGSGAFCLSKWYPAIEKDFTDGIHLRVWKDFNELEKLISYYLNPANEEERKRIAEAGCNHVQKNCNWDQRMIELKQLMVV